MGEISRKTKIDELPQLFNILKGEMAIVGPRQESIMIVKKFNDEWMRETLCIRPGLASPGSIFNYTNGEKYSDDNSTEEAYVEKLMPIKLGMDYYYVKHFSLFYDIQIICRTIKVITLQVAGRTDFRLPKEYKY